MAKRSRKSKSNGKPRKKRSNGTSREVVAVGGNYRKAVKDFVGRIENLKADLESERGKYMNACRPIHEDIAEIYSEAKGEGIATKALKAAVKIRDLEKKKDAEREKLDSPDQDELDRIRLALGELATTELGRAAIRAAETPATDSPQTQPDA